MDFFDNHNRLFGTATLFFVVLTIFVAILPAVHNQRNNAPLPSARPLSEEATRGKAVFIANGCVACHTQQVRNVDMDKAWGTRPSMSADYAGIFRTDFWRNTATLMGTERTGPDLTSVGTRQPGADWNLVHLYNPRIVVKESIMPAYPWLFEIKKETSEGDVIINVPEDFLHYGGKIVAGKDALDLVAYLQSLQQASLPDGTEAASFLYKREKKTAVNEGVTAGEEEPDGASLYTAHCQSCHQPDGMGLPGAFPPLKGSDIVLNDNPDTFVRIIMQGYDARAEYGFMPAVGDNAGLSAAEVAAIMNHERTNWGNDAKKISTSEVQTILDAIKAMPVQ